MKLFFAVLLAFAAALPRGIQPKDAAHYSDQTFRCLDGSRTLVATRVNDDYCDCADGSDEPGTSACTNGRFYCENKGHEASLLFSSFVNDGVCDCCDGSDEWSGVVSCKNTCEELGAIARERAAETQKNLEAGRITKAKYIAYYQQEIAKIKENHDALKTSIETQKAALETLEKTKNAAQEALNQVLNRLIDDLKKQQANEADAADAAEEDEEDEEDELLDSDAIAGEESDADDDEGNEAEAKLTEQAQSHPDYLPLKEASDIANREYDEAKKKLDNDTRQVETMATTLSRDYGPSGEYYQLSQLCFQYTTQEYTYDFCPYQQIMQKAGSSTNMGAFTKWLSPNQQAYENGQGCWNGPKRSVKVTFQCHNENVVQSVEEPSRCEYALTMLTPAACEMPEHKHDEL